MDGHLLWGLSNNLTVIIVVVILYILINKIAHTIILIKFPDLKNLYAIKIDELEQRVQKLELKTAYERAKNQNQKT
jgi:hypothetical protein